MDEENINDFSEKIRKDSRRSMIKFIAFMSVLVIILGLYVTKDRWLPKGSVEGFFNGDEVTDGNFPLQITNGMSYQTCRLGDGFALLSDSWFYIYSEDGERLENRAHTYTNAILKQAGSRALIYEQGGSSFRVEGIKKSIYQHRFSDGFISMAFMSEKGIVAVVSVSEKYVCELHIFDKDGEEIYFRGCSQRIMDVVFNRESDGCYLVTIDAEKGKIVSKAFSVDFNSKDIKWESENLQTCCISSYITDDDGVFIFGDTECDYFDKNGQLKNLPYKGNLIDAAFKGKKAALIFESKERRKTTLAMLEDWQKEKDIMLTKTVKSIFAEEEAVYVMTETDIEAYGYDGALLKRVEIKEPYNDFYKVGDYIMLFGYNEINRIEFVIK